MGVTEYWRFDPTGEHFTPPLVAERLVDGEYRPIPIETDADGILRGHSAVLGLDICVIPDFKLRLYDPENGQWLRTHAESEAALQEEARLRQTAEDRVQEEARLRQTAEDRAQEEARLRQAAEEELRQLREQLGNPPSG